MGCCQSSDDSESVNEMAPSQVPDPELPGEEKVVAKVEKNLAFSQKVSKEFIKCLKSEALNNALSAPQLKRAFFELKIPDSEMNNPDSRTFVLLANFKNEKKLYDLQKLTLLGVLLGKGDLQEKAEWLFKQYDLDASGMLDKSEVTNMLNALLEVSCEILPKASVGSSAELISKESCNEYVSSLQAGKDSLISSVINELMQEEEISLSEFKMKLSGPGNLSKVLTSTGCRSLAYKAMI